MPLDETQKKEVEETVLEVIRRYNKSATFTDRKTIDLPTESNSPINRRFVTLNGATTARPVSSIAVVGQRYFDTTINKPIYYTTAGWRDATSSIVAQNN